MSLFECECKTQNTRKSSLNTMICTCRQSTEDAFSSPRHGLLAFHPSDREYNLAHDRHGDFGRGLGSNVEANRRLDARNLRFGDTGGLEALHALGVIARASQCADVEAVRLDSQLEGFIVNVADVGERHHGRV